MLYSTSLVILQTIGGFKNIKTLFFLTYKRIFISNFKDKKLDFQITNLDVFLPTPV